MGSTRQELADAAGLPAENFHPVEPGLHMEIMDAGTRMVWQAMANVSQEDYETLVVEAPYQKTGVGVLAGYCSYFRKSPNADHDGPMETLELGGYSWSRCAQPAYAPRFPAGPDGPTQIEVNKHHTIVYAAGSELFCLESPESETSVQVVGTAAAAEALTIPDGWSRSSVKLEEETSVELPCPTSALFFSAQPELLSFQGPVPRPASVSG